MKQVYGIFTKVTTIDPETSEVTEDQDFLIIGYGIWSTKTSATRYCKKVNKDLWNGVQVYYVLPLPLD